MNHKLGIIGGGFVGSATAWAFRPTHEVRVYDCEPKASTHSFEDVANCDFIFVCVPTPPNHDWTVDLSIVEKVLSKLKELTWAANQAIGQKYPIVLIKSTVLPGTCRKMSEKYGLKIVSNPEFLTERRAKWDFVNAAQILIGADDESSATKVRELYQERFNSMKYTITDTITSELIKYTINCFFATKVSFMNEIKSITEKIGADWEKVIEGFTSDCRIGDSHVDVPGPDGMPGFGGKCFPKDLNGLTSFAKDMGLDATMLTAAWEKNKVIRSAIMES
tara:strand:+ start:231 stop:1061 length:831 start_codon:yes stop_codon:yes gene_type:complete